MDGELLRQCRQSRGMSIVQLSEASGLAKQTITDIENGRRGSSVSTLEALLDALGYELVVREK